MPFDSFLNQIKSDDGIAGARVRKEVQRVKDASPAREPKVDPNFLDDEQLDFDFGDGSDHED